MNKIEIKTEIGVSEMFEFTMNNNYKTIRGTVAVLFSLASAAGLVVYWNQFSGWQKALLLFFALMFTIIEPIEYYLRSKRQVKKNFTVPLNYIFDNNGIEIHRNEETAHNDWQEVMKVITTKKSVIIYLSPVRAFILPKKDIGDQYQSLKNLMEDNTSCYKFKM
ncbi:MAG: YcxB family protein [Lachnospiraceae bacterium]|nr:YcxB family protein [Lachnospiraceae bacterium]